MTTHLVYCPPLDRHVQQLRALKHNRFFTGFGTRQAGPGCRYAVRLYPRDIEPRGPEGMLGDFYFQLSPANRHSFVGGSKLRAYRRARQVIIANRSYLEQRYTLFSGPVGILP